MAVYVRQGALKPCHGKAEEWRSNILIFPKDEICEDSDVDDMRQVLKDATDDAMKGWPIIVILALLFTALMLWLDYGNQTQPAIFR